jgi:hypothetical protein
MDWGKRCWGGDIKSLWCHETGRRDGVYRSGGYQEVMGMTSLESVCVA